MCGAWCFVRFIFLKIFQLNTFQRFKIIKKIIFGRFLTTRSKSRINLLRAFKSWTIMENTNRIIFLHYFNVLDPFLFNECFQANISSLQVFFCWNFVLHFWILHIYTLTLGFQIEIFDLYKDVENWLVYNGNYA